MSESVRTVPSRNALPSSLARFRGIPPGLWVAWLFTALAFWPVLPAWVGDWIHDPNYSQGFLIPLVTAYLMWEALDDGPIGSPPHERRRTASAGPILAVTGLLGYVLGTAGSEYFTMRSSFVITLIGAAWWIGGAAIGSAVAIPILFLLFSVPIPAVVYFHVAGLLQRIVAAATAILLSGLGVPIVRDGNVLQLPEAALEVADACSGVRSLTVLLALGALWAYLSRRGSVRSIVLFLATIPLVIVGNVVRLSVTGIGTYTLGPWFAEGAAHELLGVVVFGVTALGLLGLSSLLGKPR